MNSLEKGVVTLIKSALTGEGYSLPADFDVQNAVKIARAHQISALVCFGAKTCNLADELAMDKLLVDAYKFTVISEAQTEFIDKITAVFKKENIDYMLLKGASIKNIYPNLQMRTMSDIDILIKLEQYDKISKIMHLLGFSEVTQSDHELIWRKENLAVELHKRLIPSYNKDFYAYFGDGWQFAKREENSSCHKMSAEDELVFIFTHLAKHYRDAGIGLKHFVDLFLFLKNNTVDQNYVLGVLKTLKLDVFYTNVLKTLNVWFDGGQEDEITKLITKNVFSCGAYGKRENKLLSEAVKENKKAFKTKKVLSLVFLPIAQMQKRYSCLKKAPILLPVFWVVRWIKIVLKKRQTVREQMHYLKNATNEKISEYQFNLNKVGLDFNFKE